MIWLFVHSAALAAVAVAVIGGADVGIAAAVAAVESILAFALLFTEGGVSARRWANAVTGIRLAAAVVALAAVGTGVEAGTIAASVVFGLLVLGELSDYLDGLVARRTGPTAFGARLDMETDALFMLTLAIVANAWSGLGAWVIIAGLLRYAVAIPFFFLPAREFSRRFRRFARVAAGTAATCLVIANFPPAPFALRVLAASVALGLLVASFGWEAVARIRHARRSPPERLLEKGLLRSVVTYYGVPLRLVRMKRFYRRFVSPGDLVMDVGAHVGNRVRAFRSLGARVIAVEPQKGCVSLLARLYGDDPDVTIEPVACGAHSGEGVLRVPSTHPTLATLSPEWSESIDRHYGTLGIEWDRDESVSIRTLDELIGRHGVPTFIKIDVEGFEHLALAGLSRPVRALSFEFLPASLVSALLSLGTVAGLGPYRFNYSMVERMRFSLPRWVGADEMEAILRGMSPTDRSGDVYAVLQERQS